MLPKCKLKFEKKDDIQKLQRNQPLKLSKLGNTKKLNIERSKRIKKLEKEFFLKKTPVKVGRSKDLSI